ncbi:hypothetical protein LXL04_014148 [Taraxacum kok-saghyz]
MQKLPENMEKPWESPEEEDDRRGERLTGKTDPAEDYRWQFVAWLLHARRNSRKAPDIADRRRRSKADGWNGDGKMDSRKSRFRISSGNKETMEKGGIESFATLGAKVCVGKGNSTVPKEPLCYQFILFKRYFVMPRHAKDTSVKLIEEIKLVQVKRKHSTYHNLKWKRKTR